MTAPSIDHGSLAKLAEAGAVRAAHVIGGTEGWGIVVTHGNTARTLASQRGKARLFRKLETVVAYLKEVGIARFDVDAAVFEPGKAPRTRPDRAEALKRAHQAAAYDKWFRGQVQAALDDPRPSVAQAEVSARWQKKRAQLLKKVKA